MSKKAKEKQPPSPPSSSSSYDESDSDSDSPPPAISPLKNPNPSIPITTIPQKQQQQQQQQQQQISGSEDQSTEEEESSDDSRPAAANQPPNPSPPSDDDTANNDEEVDSSAESDPKEASSAGAKNSVPDSSSDDESEKSAGPKPLSSRPMDDDADANPTKRSAASPAQGLGKRRRVEGGQKKEGARRIWGKDDELILLQCFLDCGKKHGGVSPESLLKSVNDSLAYSVSLNQINDKIRRLKGKYNAGVKRVSDGKGLDVSNPHDAAFFDLSRRIWGKEEDVLAESDFKKDEVRKIGKEDGKKTSVSVKEYPFLRWRAENDHGSNALVVQSCVSAGEAKELEESCKKLEIAEIGLHMKKNNLLSLGLKLIDDAIEKL